MKIEKVAENGVVVYIEKYKTETERGLDGYADVYFNCWSSTHPEEIVKIVRVKNGMSNFDMYDLFASMIDRVVHTLSRPTATNNVDAILSSLGFS